MTKIRAEAAIVSIVYSDSAVAAALLWRVARSLRGAGIACAGFVQHDEPRQGRSLCDMVLENLSSGERLAISEDRGPGARGCRLDAGSLMAALQTAHTALASGPEVLILNKFGKSESEGGGFRPLIAEALALDIPVLIGVPWRNVESWRIFTGGLAREFATDELGDLSDDALLVRIGLQLATGVSHSGSVANVVPYP